MIHDLSDTTKHWLDAGAAVGTAGVLIGLVPKITAVVMLIWGVMRLYECWLNIQIKRRTLADD